MYFNYNEGDQIFIHIKEKRVITIKKRRVPGKWTMMSFTCKNDLI
jgi:hypothetical protein